MSTVQTTLALQDKMSATLRTIATAMGSTLNAMKAIKGAEFGPEFQKAAGDIKIAEMALNDLSGGMSNFKNSSKSAGDGFTTLKGLAVNAITSIVGNIRQMGTELLKTVDFMTSATARINNMNDGMQTTAQLQQLIFQSAQRSRGEYLATVDTVAKLGSLAGEAFANSKEIITFTELMNKSFVLAGTGIEGQTAAMRQLTQAMASGRLQGDEFVTIIENAKPLAQAIANYMGIPFGQLKELSSQGVISSSIIKNALFSIADDINNKYSAMPMTIGQMWTIASNNIINSMTPVLNAIAGGAQTIYENWDKVAPVFVGITGAVLTMSTAYGIYTAATWLAVTANQVLIASLMSNPFTLIGVALAIVIGQIYNWVQSVGGMSIAWAITVDAIMSATDRVIDTWNYMILALHAGGLNIIGNMEDMRVSVLQILQNMVNGAIDIINKFIAATNKIPGVSIGLVDQVSFATDAAASAEGRKQRGLQGLSAHAGSVYETSEQRKIAARERELGILEMQQKAAGAGQEDLFAGLTTSDAGGGKALKTKNVDKLITDEEIKMLSDIAGREYQLKYQQITPQITLNFSGDIRETADVNAIVNTIAEQLADVAASNLMVLST